jgi:hypothetical protein
MAGILVEEFPGRLSLWPFHGRLVELITPRLGAALAEYRGLPKSATLLALLAEHVEELEVSPVEESPLFQSISQLRDWAEAGLAASGEAGPEGEEDLGGG